MHCFDVSSETSRRREGRREERGIEDESYEGIEERRVEKRKGDRRRMMNKNDGMKENISRIITSTDRIKASTSDENSQILAAEPHSCDE